MSKTQTAYDAIREMADALGPAQKLPTVVSLCDQLRVSRVTLDRALSKLQQEGAIVRKHGRGIYTSSAAQSRTVAVLFGSNPFEIGASYYYRLLLDRFNTRCDARKYHLELYMEPLYRRDAAPNRRRLENDIEAGRVHGVFLPQNRGTEYGPWLRQQKIPFLILGATRRCGFGVTPNRERILKLGVEALVARGCQHLGLVSHIDRRQYDRYGNIQLALFGEMLEWNDRSFNETRSYVPVLETDEKSTPAGMTLEEYAYHATFDLFGQSAESKPDGLVVMDDTMARGVLVALQQLGLCIGQDVKVAAMSNKGSPTLLGFASEIVQLEIDPAEIADESFDMLDTLMDGREPRRCFVAVDPKLQPAQPASDISNTGARPNTSSPTEVEVDAKESTR